MNLQQHHAEPLDEGAAHLMNLIVSARDGVGKVVKDASGHSYDKRSASKYASREGLLRALMPVLKKNHLHMYFAAGELPAPGMTRQMLVIVGVKGAGIAEGRRLVVTQDFPIVQTGGKDPGQATGSVMTYAARYLMVQAFALELVLEKDLDDPSRAGPVVKCKHCHEPMHRRIISKKSENAELRGKAFYCCPKRDNKNPKDPHSFCLAAELKLKGEDGDWERQEIKVGGDKAAADTTAKGGK